MVVANPIFEAGRRSGWLNPPDQTLGDEKVQRVVHRLERDGTDLGPDDRGHRIGGDVRRSRDGPKDGQPLSRDLNPTLAKKRRLLAKRPLVDAGGSADVDRRRRDPAPHSLSDMEK